MEGSLNKNGLLPVMQGYTGKIEGLFGEHLHGWAIDLDDLSKRVVVEILVDQVSVGVTVADIFHHEYSEQKLGDGCCGFAFRLPAAALTKGRKFEARVANTTRYLAGAEVLDGPISRAGITSSVQQNGGLRLVGWAVNQSQPDRKVSFGVFIDSVLYKHFDADLVNMHAPEFAQHAGFDISLPFELADGEVHEVALQLESGEHLAGSPIAVAHAAEGISALYQQQHAGQQGADFAVLEKVLTQFSDFVPRSVGFGMYRDWYESYGKPGATEGGGAECSIGYLVYRRRPDASIEKTIKSILIQGVVPASIAYIANPQGENSSSLKTLCESHRYIAVVEAGDTLADGAVEHLSRNLLGSAPGILYTDCDQDNDDGERSNPWFKPAWDYDFFLSTNYIAPLCLVRSDIAIDLVQLGPVELIYGAVEACLKRGDSISHLPEICYHRSRKASSWRSEGALLRLLDRVEVNATAHALDGIEGFRVQRSLSEQPLVSIIIPTRDRFDLLSRCIESVLERSSYPNYEIIVMDNQSRDEDVLDYFEILKGRGIRVLSYDKAFNYSAINNEAVRHAKGEVLCLLNNDVEVITTDWLEEMLSHLQRETVGIVGAKLLWPNDMVQHGGVLLGLNSVAGHFGNNLMDGDAGFLSTNQVVRQCSAVTAACLLISKQDYQDAGALDECAFPVAFNDVDLCLKVRERGKEVVWTPFAKLYHFESASRGKEDRPEKLHRSYREINNLRERWLPQLICDPFYNPNLNLDAMGGVLNGLALPPRDRRVR